MGSKGSKQKKCSIKSNGNPDRTQTSDHKVFQNTNEIRSPNRIDTSVHHVFQNTNEIRTTTSFSSQTSIAAKKSVSSTWSKITSTNNGIQRKLSEPLHTDTIPFKDPQYAGYKSPFQKRLGPLDNLRFRNGISNFQETRRASEPRIVPSAAASSTGGQNVDPLIPTYHFKRSPKGKVLIVNIKKFFEKKEERHGSEVDVDNLTKLFRDDMKFKVTTHSNLTAKEIGQKIKNFRDDKSLYNVDISLVVVMSHGDNKRNCEDIPGGFTQVIGTDGEGILIDKILAMFSAESCPSMKGKPKIFIFQCCRGDKGEVLATDQPKSPVNQNGDILVAYSTIPGFYSIRDPQKGTWYIQCICKVFKEHSSTHDFESLLKIVQQELNKKHLNFKQTSMYENRGFKKCFLQGPT